VIADEGERERIDYLQRRLRIDHRFVYGDARIR